MKRIILLLAIFLILLLPKISSSQWVQQSVPVTGGYFNDMQFVNAATGFIINWNNPVATFLKTTNAGYNWQTMNNWGMAHIEIVDTGCIYTSGQNDFGKIYKSSNLGITWDSMLTTSSYYSYLHFFNRDTGIISGGNSFSNFIWRTTNGGQSIQLIATYGGASPGKFYFLKEKINGEYNGWMYYPGSSLLKNTTNSGMTWNSLPSFSGNLNSIFFVNQDTGWATSTSYTNYIYMTTNGGVNWVGKYNNLNLIYYEIYFANSQKGWVSGPSYKVCVTTNGGNNWGTQNIQGDYSSKLFFLDSLNGWIKTSLNTISYTTNGGGPITVIETNSNSIVNNFKLYQNYPNPFNPSTTIKYKILKSSYVRIEIMDMLGRAIQELVNEKQVLGTYEVNFKSENLGSGIYFYRLTVIDNNLNTVFSETKRMILLK